jgi:hypothetical protein
LFIVIFNGAVDTAYNFCFVTEDLVLDLNVHRN